MTGHGTRFDGLGGDCMTELLRVPIGDEAEGSLVAEIRPDPRDLQQVSRAGERIVQATQTLQDALQPITRAAEQAVRALRETELTTVQLEFGLRLHAKSGVVLTEAGAEGHVRVTVTWERAAAGADRPRPPADTDTPDE